MKIVMRAAMAALSFASIGAAYAGESEGAVANRSTPRSGALSPRLRCRTRLLLRPPGTTKP